MIIKSKNYFLKIKLLFFFLLLFSLIASYLYIHFHLKKEYIELGFIEGNLRASSLIIELITKNNIEITKCNDNEKKIAIEFISAKADMIYIIKKDLNLFSFCRSQ